MMWWSTARIFVLMNMWIQ